jgi:hypothetical protein
VRVLLPILLLLACALPAAAQPERATLLADLEAGLASRDGEVAESAASRLQRLSRAMDRPEALLPLVERAVLSGRGTAEYGVVGSGQTAFARVAERASAGAPVLVSLESLLRRLKPGLLREWIASGVNKLARRFPGESRATIGRLLEDAQGSVREHARSALFEATQRLPPSTSLVWLDGLLAGKTLRKGNIEDVRLAASRVLRLAGRVPASEVGAYRTLLDDILQRAKSAELRTLVRETRAELDTRAVERAGKTDRFASFRRADGSLNWGEVFRSPFSSKKAASAGEGFATRRPGAKGEVVKGFLPDVVATEVFKTVNAAAIEVSEAEAKALSGKARAPLEARIARLRGLNVRYVETNDIVARRAGKTVEVSYGLLHEVYARSMKLMESGKITTGERGMYQARVLGLVFAHEVGHAMGLKAERPADARAIQLVWGSMLKPGNAAQGEVALRGTIDLFDRPTGARAFDTLLYRIRSFFRYGTPRGRLEAMRRAARGEADALAPYRRADGTVKWQKAAADKALVEAAGLAKFGLALFLKELALVAQTGDTARIGEFFDYLLTTDFYKHYGLFVAGARLGEVAYGRYLSRYVKPRFVNGILKTNLALAAGMALPMIVEGNFEGRAFAISFASLGLSSTLVSSGVRAIRWVTTLRKARGAGVLARFGPAAGRLARAGGWLYTVGELAVVLYLADTIEAKANEWLDERRARTDLAEAGAKLLGKLGTPGLSAEGAELALREHHDAWIGYRDFLFAPLLHEEARLAARVGKVARSAKLGDDERKALLTRAKSLPSLRGRLVKRYGSLEGYLDARAREKQKEIQAEVDGLLKGYDERRAELFQAVYQAKRRKRDYLAGVDTDELLSAGAGRSDAFGRMNRERAGATLARSLRNVSSNRLQAYEDEEALLRAFARHYQARPELAKALQAQLERVQRLHAADQRLARGESIVQAGPVKKGLGDHLPSKD